LLPGNAEEDLSECPEGDPPVLGGRGAEGAEGAEAEGEEAEGEGELNTGIDD